jgi:hypothetical protein
MEIIPTENILHLSMVELLKVLGEDQSPVNQEYMQRSLRGGITVRGGNNELDVRTTKAERIASFSKNPVVLSFATVPIYSVLFAGPEKVTQNQFLRSAVKRYIETTAEMRSKVSLEQRFLQPIGIQSFVNTPAASSTKPCDVPSGSKAGFFKCTTPAPSPPPTTICSEKWVCNFLPSLALQCASPACAKQIGTVQLVADATSPPQTVAGITCSCGRDSDGSLFATDVFTAKVKTGCTDPRLPYMCCFEGTPVDIGERAVPASC